MTCSRRRARWADIEDPSKSDVFKKLPEICEIAHALNFLCDTLRVAVSCGVDQIDIDEMEIDLEVQHREGHEPCAALTTMAIPWRSWES
jgi:chemotaxis protein MotA